MTEQALSKHELTQLKENADLIRESILKMHFQAKSGHVGSSLSCVDILTYLYSFKLSKSYNRFILSKGHAASCLYATLWQFKLISKREFDSYYKDGTLLPAHPAALGISQISVATGSLGHGFPIAAGMAYGLKKYKKSNEQIYVLLSDGECNEGSNWEAAMFAAHHQLDNLTVIIDYNGLQGFGRTNEVIDMHPLAKKWSAFNFNVMEISGHNFDEIHTSVSNSVLNRPRCIIAKTIKGNGVSFMENRLEWHYLPMTEDQFKIAMNERKVGSHED